MACGERGCRDELSRSNNIGTGALRAESFAVVRGWSEVVAADVH
jgi:hypothetical protein